MMTPSPVVPRASLEEYFKRLVDDAVRRQRVAMGEVTSDYLVRLLAGFARTEAAPRHDQPLGVRLLVALQQGGRRQRAELRQVGDAALFLCGYFADSLSRRAVDVDYYVSVGGWAYGSLSQCGDPELARLYEELACRFQRFVDIITEVSERGMVSTNADRLRLYTRWLRTGSRRAGERLVDLGIVPNASIGSRFIQ